jgi:hypothetical protein
MNRLMGIDVRVSSLITDAPKVRWNCKPEDETPTIQRFNAWLAERFGYRLTYWKVGDVIFTNERGYAALKQATKDKK